jgi:hypothetical protein
VWWQLGFLPASSTNHTLFNSLSDLVALLSTLLTPFHLYIVSVGMFRLWAWWICCHPCACKPHYTVLQENEKLDVVAKEVNIFCGDMAEHDHTKVELYFMVRQYTQKLVAANHDPVFLDGGASFPAPFQEHSGFPR